MAGCSAGKLTKCAWYLAIGCMLHICTLSGHATPGTEVCTRDLHGKADPVMIETNIAGCPRGLKNIVQDSRRNMECSSKLTFMFHLHEQPKPSSASVECETLCACSYRGKRELEHQLRLRLRTFH